MNLDKTLASYFKIAGYLMAIAFLAAILTGISDPGLAVFLSQIGIAAAIAIPIFGIVIALVILFRKSETNYGLITIILLAFILMTVIWRIFA